MTSGGFLLACSEDSNMAISVAEDMGFCSGEDYLESEVHSPTDTSEDSLEVKISTIQLKNKRKCPESSRKDCFSRPLKKRMCLKVKSEESRPFRPWTPQTKTEDKKVVCDVKTPNPSFVRSPVTVPSSTNYLYQNHGYFRPPSPVRTEPVSLVSKIKNESDCSKTVVSEVRVPVHPAVTKLSPLETEKAVLKTAESFPDLQPQSSSKKPEQSRREQRNYKNMTRERRIEANARERTRVHTISAAFDTLRKSIPSYSHNQKLSKLSVLRIACSYIMTLSSIVDDDQNETTTEYVDLVSKTIQREGKLRKKKDDND